VSRWSTQAESTAFLEALAGHATLRKLSLSSNAVDDHPVARDEMGALMATLLSTESALRELDVSACALADEGILQLAVGLAASTQLQSLRCEDNDASLAAALQLAQAAEACTSLTQLNCDFEEDADPEMVRCLDLVWERAEQQQQQQQS
jgi:Ran GTPase-activating protein (RanGAP) involved in mRNA processing and transport